MLCFVYRSQWIHVTHIPTVFKITFLALELLDCFFYGHRSNINGGYIQSIPTHKNTQKINANVLVCDLFRTSWRFNPRWGISPGLNNVYGNTNASLGKSRLLYSLPLNSYRLYSQNTLALLWWSNNILNAIEVEWMRVHKSIETAISVES